MTWTSRTLPPWKAWSGFETALDEFEDVLYASDKDWNIISSKIDVQSFADYYLISEWVENWDTFKSSTFCYRTVPTMCCIWAPCGTMTPP